MRAIVAPLALVVAGCAAAPVDEEPPKIDLSGACSASIADVPRVAVPKPRPKRVPHDFNEWSYSFQKVAGCFESGEVRTAAVVVDLGERSGVERVEVAVWTGAQGFVSPLNAAVYDSAWAPVADAGFEEFGQRGTKFTHTFFVPDGVTVGFLVLMADDGRVDESLQHVAGYSTETMICGAAGCFTVHGGGEAQHDIKFAHGGWFSVQPIVPEPPASE